MTIEQANKAESSMLNPIFKFYVSDVIREELGGKFSALGLYSDAVIVAEMTPDRPDPTDASPLALDALCFLLNISGLEGVHHVKMYLADDLISTDQRGIEADIPFPSAPQSINLLLRIQPFLTGSLGIKRIVLEIGDKQYSLPFEMRRRFPSVLKQQ